MKNEIPALTSGMDRRRFLFGTGLTVAGMALARRSLAESKSPAAPPNDLSTWQNVRAQFAISPDYINLSGFFLASHPKPVREAIDNYRRALDNDPFEVVEREEFGSQLRVEGLVAEYLGAKPEEVALTDSTTMGLALIYHGLTFKKGDEILTTEHDHYAQHESIRLAAARSGATVRKIKLFDDYKSISSDEIVSRIRKSISPATRVVGVTWVHSSSGLRLPIQRIAGAIAEVNRKRGESDRVLLVVDGVHGIGAVDETIAELGADFFSAGTHKWMFGPRGTGIVWAKAENWKLLQPVIPSFAERPYTAWMQGRDPGATEARWVSPGGFHSFEHRWALPAAFAFHRQIGRARVAERIRTLNSMAKEELAKMSHVEVHTPRDPELSAGLICFDVKGMKPAAVVEKLLEKRVIASESPYAASHARLSPSLLNNEKEVEQALGYIRAMA
ncbi:MAG: aminotransferase class V-fold PLP-dependent enzyme [Chthoniobacterales bacterium]